VDFINKPYHLLLGQSPSENRNFLSYDLINTAYTVDKNTRVATVFQCLHTLQLDAVEYFLVPKCH